jgi:hypothetical protein
MFMLSDFTTATEFCQIFTLHDVLYFLRLCALESNNEFHYNQPFFCMQLNQNYQVC